MEKLLAIISAVQRVSTKKLLIQVLSNMVLIIGLVITTAIMISATFIASLINAHAALLNHGTPPALAFAYIGGAALLIIFGLVSVIAWRVRYLKRIPHSVFGQSPLTSRARDTLDAFTAGFMAD